MPSPYRILVVAAHAAAIAFFLAPPAAQASPMPMPLSSYSARNVYDATSRAERSRSPVSRDLLGPEDLPVAGGSDSSEVVPAVARDVNTSNILNNINILNGYYDRASTNSNNLKSYSSQASSRGNDPDFQQQCKTELTSYQANQQGFQTALAQMGGDPNSDKGLGNYDKNKDLETLLKNYINLNKDTLSYVDELVDSIPILGPILGPIVYEIKCILDAVLDALEDFTDDLLNRLGSMLRPLIGSYSVESCKWASLALGDICII